MSADVIPDTRPDSRPLYRLIRRTRALLRSSWVLTGLALTAGLLLSAAVVTAVVDLFVPLPTALRLTALLLIVVPSSLAFLAGVVLPLCRRLGNVHVARRIEDHLPGIHNRLVSCIDLETNAPKQTTSTAFFRRLLTEALERIRGFRPWKIVELRWLRRAGAFALVGAVAFAVAWLLFSDRLPTALARIGQPFADIPPASGIAYDVQPRDADVLREEPVTFLAEVTTDKQPDELWVELQGGPGSKPIRRELERSEENERLWSRSLDSARLGDGYEDGFRYRVKGGGTWSPAYRVRLVERPVIDKVTTKVRCPDYMGLDEPPGSKKQTSGVTGPEGGMVRVTVESHGEVSRGAVQLLKPGMVEVPPQEQRERTWFTDRPPADSKPDGTWQSQRKNGQDAHTEPPHEGTPSHWFNDDPAGHVVREGDHLFTYVYLSPEHRTKGILLKWHDGKDWNHGAVWGQDDFPLESKRGTAARHHVDALPRAGEWVRLEVPAALVDLEGKTLHGMAFKLNGGQCFWRRTGTIQKKKPSLVVAKSFTMSPDGDRWTGHFPLTGKGQFRVELRNESGHPNKEMEAIRFVAEPDNPPQVAVERPGSDLVLSKPDAPPLTIAAFDDFGLAEINLLTRTNPTDVYQSRTLKHFDRPERAANLVVPLEEAAKLAVGGQLFYVVEAKDRKKQTMRTREYAVRVAVDPNAADQQLTNFDKSQDPLRDRLIQLMGEQKKVQETVNKLDGQYAALADKVRAAYQKAREEQAAKKPEPGKPPVEPVLPKLDPEVAKELAALQAELTKLGQQETQNAATAQQLSTDLARAAEQGRNLQLMPEAVAEQMRAMQEAFQRNGVQALNDLAKAMQQGADPKQGPGDLRQMRDRADRLEKELEATRNRMDALAQARKGLREDLQQALRDLERRMLNETGGLTARELKELHDYLAKLREELKQLQGKQEDRARRGEQKPDLVRAEQEQEELERELSRTLANVRNLLDAGKKRKAQRRPPEFPEAPYSPDGKEEKVPPKEDDTDEPLPGRKTDPQTGKQTGNKKDDKKDEEDEKDEFMPALGGKKPVLDKRFEGKQRPVQRRPGDRDPDARRNDLASRQADQARALEAAQQALASDQQTLQRMMQALQQAMQANGQQGRQGRQGQQGEADQAMAALRQMLQSGRMQQALGMAGRMRQGPPPSGQPGEPRPPAIGPSQGNLNGSPVSGSASGELAKLDPATRSILLKLPPRVREDLLQGMREQGPEGYGPFIEEYFKRLTETKEPTKP